MLWRALTHTCARARSRIRACRHFGPHCSRSKCPSASDLCDALLLCCCRYSPYTPFRMTHARSHAHGHTMSVLAHQMRFPNKQSGRWQKAHLSAPRRRRLRHIVAGCVCVFVHRLRERQTHAHTHTSRLERERERVRGVCSMLCRRHSSGFS